MFLRQAQKKRIFLKKSALIGNVQAVEVTLKTMSIVQSVLRDVNFGPSWGYKKGS